MTKNTETTPIEYTLLLDAMSYIRNRHNYGKTKRAQIRETLLRRFDELMEDDND